MSELDEKQKRFVEEYVIDLNGAAAAVRAGYSKDSAKEQASRLLTKDNVKAYLNEKQAIIGERNGLTQDWVLDRLKLVAERCMQAEPVLDNRGQPTGEYIFQAQGANRSLELLGKHLGLFGDKLKITIEKPEARVYPQGLDEQNRLPAPSEAVESLH